MQCRGDATQCRGDAVQRRTLRPAALLAIALALVATSAAPQVPPSASEAAAYTDVHAAAWQGDVTAIERLARAAPAKLEARDAHGRTPLHVAAFARRRDAIRALVRAGADRGALDDDRYDAVTIAAVADDEETLRTLIDLGASAARHEPLRRHRVDRGSTPRPRRRGAPACGRRRAGRPRQQPRLDRPDRSRHPGRRRAAPPGLRACAAAGWRRSAHRRSFGPNAARAGTRAPAGGDGRPARRRAEVTALARAAGRGLCPSGTAFAAKPGQGEVVARNAMTLGCGTARRHMKRVAHDLLL